MKEVSVNIQGEMLEQHFYEIDNKNEELLQSMVVNQKGKSEIDSVASELKLVDSMKYFVPDKAIMTITIDGIPIYAEPMRLADDCYYNLTYGYLDSSSYSDPIIINSSSRVFTSDPEEWLYNTQRVYDYIPHEQFLSAINSLLIKGANNTNLQDKDYWIKTITSYSAFKYDFTIADDFDIDKLGLLLDPYINFYNSDENVIPDFILYDDIYCGGECVYSSELKYDWAKGLLKSTAEIIIDFTTSQAADDECNNISIVPF